MKKIFTRKGHVIFIDDDDHDLVSQSSWYLNHKGYPVSERNGKHIFLHRLVMKITDPKIQVDHIKGNKLDNRKSQLRPCTNQQNQFNRGKNKNNTSGFKGVKWRRDRSKWIAVIQVNHKRKILGSFDCPKKASRAYVDAAKKLHGEFACIN
jgi:hypothetical protein